MKKKLFCAVFAFVIIFPCLLLFTGCGKGNDDNNHELTFQLENWDYYDEDIKDCIYIKFTEKFARDYQVPKKMNFNELAIWVNEGNSIAVNEEIKVQLYIISSRSGLNVQNNVCSISEPNTLSKTNYVSPVGEQGYYITYTHIGDTVLTIDLKRVTN